MRPGRAEPAILTARTPAEALALARELALRCADVWRAEAILAELLVNAVEHGNLEIDAEDKRALLACGRFETELAARLADPRYASRTVRVTARLHGSGWQIDIHDEGRGFYPIGLSVAGSVPRHGAGGRGLALVTQLLGRPPEFLDGGACARVHLPAAVSESESSASGGPA